MLIVTRDKFFSFHSLIAQTEIELGLNNIVKLRRRSIFLTINFKKIFIVSDAGRALRT